MDYRGTLHSSRLGGDIMPELLMTFIIGYALIVGVAALWWIALVILSE